MHQAIVHFAFSQPRVSQFGTARPEYCLRSFLRCIWDVNVTQKRLQIFVRRHCRRHRVQFCCLSIFVTFPLLSSLSKASHFSFSLCLNAVQVTSSCMVVCVSRLDYCEYALLKPICRHLFWIRTSFETSAAAKRKKLDKKCRPTSTIMKCERACVNEK